jgi:curved DNA-binding protein CbpA
MKEDWEDYYEILGVSPDSTAEEIKKAYLYKANIFHPDRLMRVPESVRRRAEEELKKVNRAYGVLGNAQKRQEYHSEWLKQRAKAKEPFIPKPKPIVEPAHIRFSSVEPGEIKSASFIIRNLGGPYTKIWFSNPDSWVRVVRWASLTTSDELPLKVEIEAEGEEWEKSYSEYIRVKLDEEETQVRIELQTKPEPAREKVAVSGIPTARRLLRHHQSVLAVASQHGQNG